MPSNSKNLAEYLNTDTTSATADIADGSITLAKLSASGTKNNTTFLRGDNTFSALSTTLAGLDDATVNASDPTYNQNIAGASVGHLWINSTSGEAYVLTYATTNANELINVGDTISTSGIGGIFPPFILIGQVSSITDNNIEVKLFEDIEKLTHVRILEY